MSKRYVRIGFGSYKDSELSVIAGTVCGALNENEYFENPPLDLAILQEALDDYRIKLERALRGGPYDAAEKNYSRDILSGYLQTLANYVNDTGKGVLRILLSSGFPLKADRTPLQSPTTPERARLIDGAQSRQLCLVFDPVKGAWEYEYCYSEEKDENGGFMWSELVRTSSSRNNIIAPVIPGQMYYAKVRARNRRGISDWAEPVQLIAR